MLNPYSKECGKMVYIPKYIYGNSQGAWELVKLCFIWIFTSSRPLNGGDFFILYFKVDNFMNCNISAIHTGLI